MIGLTNAAKCNNDREKREVGPTNAAKCNNERAEGGVCLTNAAKCNNERVEGGVCLTNAAKCNNEREKREVFSEWIAGLDGFLQPCRFFVASPTVKEKTCKCAGVRDEN
ncbi:hypothetical protein [Cohnella endophytica]|uniref:hypothetical protein n=1 Tax=Cohnella endophytica TaxID=2419778 RepID=UPI0011C3ED6E|nr:hypothetical protein [Cohnella endophytica]